MNKYIYMNILHELYAIYMNKYIYINILHELYDIL